MAKDFEDFAAAMGLSLIDASVMMAMSLYKDGERVQAAQRLEDAARQIRFEIRKDAMAGTVEKDALGRLLRYCGQCGRGIVVLNPGKKSFRIDRRYCSSACRQAAYRKRQPPKPAKPPKVIYL